MEINARQIKGWLKIGLSAGGPMGAVLVRKLHISTEDYTLYLEAFLFGVPGYVAIWTWFDNKLDSLIDAVRRRSDVIASVAVKDGVNGKLGKLADDPNVVSVVRESDTTKGKA